MNVVGLTVLITGASGGIGAAVARELRLRGARLLLHGSGSQALTRLGAELDAPVLPVDLAAPDGAQLLAEKALGSNGGVDVLVHSAGLGHYGRFDDMTPERVDELLDVNLRAPLQLTRALVPGMRAARRGHIVFLGSIAGLVGVAHEAAYAATKAGLIGLAESLRPELAGSGIGVTVVCPGAVDTGFFARRGRAYDRRVPRLQPPARVARDVIDAIEGSGGRHVVPPWLALAPAVRGAAPFLYERLARRFR